MACATIAPRIPPSTCAAMYCAACGGRLALQREDQRHRRVEVRAGYRSEDRDQHHQNGAGRKRVAEQRQCHVLGQGLRHDAGADNGRDQKQGPETLGRKSSRQVKVAHQARAFFLAVEGTRIGPRRAPARRFPGGRATILHQERDEIAQAVEVGRVDDRARLAARRSCPHARGPSGGRTRWMATPRPPRQSPLPPSHRDRLCTSNRTIRNRVSCDSAAKAVRA